MTITTLPTWIDVTSPPLVISGPCSAESQEQVMLTAMELTKIPQVRIFRAGIWKPRTRPEAFEGVGDVGLQWLQEVKKKTGLLTCVEVAFPKHIELALKHQVDILWIGARTVTNPFSVQEIASALRGVDIPVMVKNPVTPDLSAWMGAIERLAATGIDKIMAIHRGFHHFRKSPYRNIPLWEIPIVLKRQIPSIPVICDPSHISGQKPLLEEVSQKALDLGMDGLMIESHIDPDHALTDAAQQITPQELQQLLVRLVVKRPNENPENDADLEVLRAEINKLDEEVIQALAKRMEIVREIAVRKQEKSLTVLQVTRWNDVVFDRVNLGEKLGLDRGFLYKLLQLVHEESLDIQSKSLQKKK